MNREHIWEEGRELFGGGWTPMDSPKRPDFIAVRHRALQRGLNGATLEGASIDPCISWVTEYLTYNGALNERYYITRQLAKEESNG